MNGVMMPDVSAGSNQVGASETCAATRSSPSVAAAAVRSVAPIMAAVERARTSRRVVLTEAMAASPLDAALQADVFVGCGIGMPADQAECRFVNPRALAVEEGELPQRRVHRALMHQLLHAVQERRAFGAVRLRRLLGEQLVDVRVAAV